MNNQTNEISIGYAGFSVLRALQEKPVYGTLSRTPGDGAEKILQGIANVLEIESIMLSFGTVTSDKLDEYYHEIMSIVENGNAPLLFVIKDANCSADGVVGGFVERLEKNNRPIGCVFLTVFTAEEKIFSEIAEGSGHEDIYSRMQQHRTEEENARYLEKILRMNNFQE
jgi:hypothetical protein